jgi:D-sedoheptulose 7-phosphate isomerase
VTRARVDGELDELTRLMQAAKGLGDQVTAVAARYAAVLNGGGTLFFCGNGGSAADAQHVAAEYVVRYARSRRSLAAVALTTDTSILTAAANDLGFEHVFARQVEALCRPGDLLVLHSTSGRSPNVLAAARAARDRGVGTVAFVGQGDDGLGGPLAKQADQAIVVPSVVAGRIQVLHLALEHLIVELIEDALLPTA